MGISFAHLEHRWHTSSPRIRSDLSWVGVAVWRTPEGRVERYNVGKLSGLPVYCLCHFSHFPSTSALRDNRTLTKQVLFTPSYSMCPDRNNNNTSHSTSFFFFLPPSRSRGTRDAEIKGSSIPKPQVGRVVMPRNSRSSKPITSSRPATQQM